MFSGYYAKGKTQSTIAKSLPIPCIFKSCIEIKIKLNFYFYTSFWGLKRFYKGLKRLRKTFWDTTKKCENKNLTYFFSSSGIEMRRVKYSDKDTPIFRGHRDIFCDIGTARYFLWCLLALGKTMAFFFIFDELTDGNLQWTDKSRCSVEQLNIVKSTLALNLLLVTEHLNSWKNEPVLSLINYTTKKKTIFCENKFSVQNRSTNVCNIDTWQERAPFLQNSFQFPSGCF